MSDIITTANSVITDSIDVATDSNDITMSLVEIKDAIVKLFNSPEYFKLKKYYAVESFFKTLKISRKELVHSCFIAWLLNPSGNHSLEDFPAKKFLQMIYLHKDSFINSDAIFTDAPIDFLIEDYLLSKNSTVQTEVSISGIKNGRIDILLELQIEGLEKTLPIVIENKVLSKEHDDQTKNYYVWAEKKYRDTNNFFKPIYVFLAPDFDEEIECECEKYIKISYQNLVEFVVAPCLLVTTEENTSFIIKNYLRCLSNISLNDIHKKDKEKTIMGFSPEEIKLLNDLVEKNSALFGAIFSARSLNPDLTEDERKIYKSAGTVTRDNSRYSLNGDVYRKGPLIVALVDDYISKHSDVNFDELNHVFDFKLVFTKKNIILLPEDVPPSLKPRMPERTLSDGTIIHINNQVQIGDMDGILKIANDLGYKIEII